jgi:transcriptional regulator with XRE-family HTH domain
MSPEFGKLRKILSGNIKKRRKILNISQEKLAELADLSAQTVNDIEGCRMWVSDKTMTKLAQALRVEAYQLLLPADTEEGGSEPKSPVEFLLTLRHHLKDYIDEQFDRILKTGF